jgi:hypothetical protein
MICSSLNRLFLTTPPLALAGHRKWRSHISAGLVFGGQVNAAPQGREIALDRVRGYCKLSSDILIRPCVAATSVSKTRLAQSLLLLLICALVILLSKSRRRWFAADYGSASGDGLSFRCCIVGELLAIGISLSWKCPSRLQVDTIRMYPLRENDFQLQRLSRRSPLYAYNLGA